MIAYTVRRIFQIFVVLIGVTLLLFLILKVTPGDPAKIMAGLGATPQAIENIRHQMGLDKPLYIQYGKFVSKLLTGKLESLTFHTSVQSLILERLPASIELGIAAFLFVVFISIPAGVVSAIYQNSSLDYFTTSVALLGVSTPVFWTALMLMIFLGVYLDILPVFGRGATIGEWSFLTIDGLLHMVIPTIALASVQTAMNVRLVRSSMLEVLGKDYIDTARSKGVKESLVILKHAVRNAILPVMTNMGIQLGTLFAGAVLTETTTDWPGLGRLMVEAISRRDQTLVFGLAFLMTLGYVTSYLLIDLLYAYVDPRIHYE